MSGERRRGWILPVIVVAIGACMLVSASRQGKLNAVLLKPANWVGLALMAVGAIVALAARKSKLLKLAGVFACGIGTIMVIYL